MTLVAIVVKVSIIYRSNRLMIRTSNHRAVTNTLKFILMEDPLHEEDFEGFAVLRRDLETQIVGMPVRGERTSKHNRLLQIEEELGEILPMLEKILPGLSQVKLGHRFSQISTDIWFL